MPRSNPSSTDDIQSVLMLDQPGRHKRRLIWLLAIIAVIAVGIGLLLLSQNNGQTIQYRFGEVTKGDLMITVTATGTLEPVNQVEVGTETSGTVKTVKVDFNDAVTEGQILATLDTQQMQAKLRQTLAALETARATVTEAKATLLESSNKLNRAMELQKRGLCSQEDCDAAQAAYDRARATVERAEAQVHQAQAQVDADRTTLAKAEIRSPINGIVLKREIEPGQTVAASFQTPVLFTLAENLTQMELKVAVDEADVGKVREGQLANFTVDAYPDQHFPATITQVRFAPETVDGVVTYETVLAVDNSALLLRPGMTATANINVEHYADALLVPNAALRYTPQVASVSSGRSSLLSRLFPRPPRTSTRPVADSNSQSRQVWVLKDNLPVAIAVVTGASNGIVTQVLEGKLPVGTKVITDTQSGS